MLNLKRAPTWFLILTLFITSCGKKGVGKLFEQKSPYEKYIQKLKEADIEKTALGKDWIEEGENVFKDSIRVQLPFKETGYFSDQEVRAAGYKFTARRGEVIIISPEWESRLAARLFIDLFEENISRDTFDRVLSTDSAMVLKYEVDEDNNFLLRLQPELLRGGKYSLTISKEPAYAFPIPNENSKTVGSFFGMERDNGRRKHEGIDIFVPKRAPVIAITKGVITGVRENRLGGKVIFLTDLKRRFNLYYAHLDSQMVSVGEKVDIGDTLGLVGNTGNAKTTPPHLHFGIYNWGYGAIDPYPFVANEKTTMVEAKGNGSYLNTTAKAKNKKVALYNSPSDNTSAEVILTKNTIFKVTALAGDFYRIFLPDGKEGYIKIKDATSIEKPVLIKIVQNNIPVFDFPDSLSVEKDNIKEGSEIEVLGQFNEYLLVNYQLRQGWINQVL